MRPEHKEQFTLRTRTVSAAHPLVGSWQLHGALCALILLGSFLLFLVQPLIAKLVLPDFGGAPAVWNSAMLIYQALLLAGYSYAHALGRISVKRQAIVQVGLLASAALWLPIGIIASLRGGIAALNPVVAVPLLLCGSIGPLFLAVAAQAPLIQRWHSHYCSGRDPYALYALSNVGSFAGLLSYPLLVEPTLGVVAQRWLWSGLYVGLLSGMCALAIWMLRSASTKAHPPSFSGKLNTGFSPSWRRMASWVLIAAIPSGLMLATTSYITTDIVAMPMLWVAPLGLYLLSFTLAFSSRRRVKRWTIALAPAAVILGSQLAVGEAASSILLTAVLILAIFFIVSASLHARLHAMRPANSHLTTFYLALSLGGVIGGGFTSLLAPVVFDWTFEFPILLLAAVLLLPTIRLAGAMRNAARSAAIGIVAIAVGGATLLLQQTWPAATTSTAGAAIIITLLAGVATLANRRRMVVFALALTVMCGAGLLDRASSSRSYFGVYAVREVPTSADTPSIRILNHGTTVHGVQRVGSDDVTRQATSYYVPRSGAGRILANASTVLGPGARIAVVGLGAGTLACYARPDQNWHFMEIDPLVVHIAKNTGHFSFLSSCTPNAQITVGDARLTIQKLPHASVDALVLDAFSSDSVPMHLLTREAFALYSRVVDADGVVLLHISSRFLNLAPVIGATVQGQGWKVLELYHRPSKQSPLEVTSRWLALSRSQDVMARVAKTDPRWTMPTAGKPQPAWTDDYASILPSIASWTP
jgi:spermidine synthase